MAYTAPTDANNVVYEGGYDPGGAVSVARELDSNANGCGPERVVTSAMDGIIGPALSQPTQTTAGADTAWSFAQKVRHIMIQNNTAGNVQFSPDAVTSAGSPILASGGTLFFDLRVTTMHLLTASAQNINGTSAGNIVVWGWM